MNDSAKNILNMKFQQGALLQTWINYDPSMDK